MTSQKVVEVFGDYWRKDDDPNDLVRQYRDIGLDALVIWEHDIKENWCETSRIINTFLEEN